MPLLGDLLIASGLIARDTFDAAMQRYRPDRHGRIGDYLVNESVISRQAIEQAVGHQRELLARGAASP